MPELAREHAAGRVPGWANQHRLDAAIRAVLAERIRVGYPVAGALLGAAVGALLAGPLADRFGRESLLIADALIYALGAMSASIEGVQGHLVDGEDVGRLVRGGQCGWADDGDGGHRDAVLVAPDQIADGVGDGQVAGDRH
jgi:hypothetical protein